MDALARRLGQEPAEVELLQQAMAHRSWCAETIDEASNERLEFLGDSVLGVVVTDHIFQAYPHLPEGELAKVRASVVNAEVLADLAAALDLGSALLLGKGEDSVGRAGEAVHPRRRLRGCRRRHLPGAGLGQDW